MLVEKSYGVFGRDDAAANGAKECGTTKRAKRRIRAVQTGGERQQGGVEAVQIDGPPATVTQGTGGVRRC
ncbi:hypothetical protein OG754_18530 [Streptomyces decoyicus]|uniref:hypothetical protein n=1 Tax=Streptomyces decoyicus TaxID=249567 RepID=UPI002E34F115|nr:hypothetical protein [Streptomyces decoyicus]